LEKGEGVLLTIKVGEGVAKWRGKGREKKQKVGKKGKLNARP